MKDLDPKLQIHLVKELIYLSEAYIKARQAIASFDVVKSSYVEPENDSFYVVRNIFSYTNRGRLNEAKSKLLTHTKFLFGTKALDEAVNGFIVISEKDMKLEYKYLTITGKSNKPTHVILLRSKRILPLKGIRKEVIDQFIELENNRNLDE